jgi:cation diffusion facilitator CzcD-associated flavoprotein CzcO
VNASTNSPAAVVVGGGPYGLAVAAHLLDRGVSVRVFGEPMDAWRHNMPKGMFLKSTPRASSISAPRPGHRLEDYCLAHGITPLAGDDPVPIDLFVGYGRWFQEQLVPIERERVTNVTRAGRGFEVTLGSGEVFTTPSVVMAAGHVQFAYVPPELAGLADGQPLPTAALSHASNHDDLSKFAGCDVAVIGRGQSALESAALLHEAGAGVRLLVRAPRVLWAGPPVAGPRPTRDRVLKPESPLGPGWSLVGSYRGAPLIRHLPERSRLAIFRAVLGPSGAWWLHDRVEPAVEIRTSQFVGSATMEGDKVALDCVPAHGTRQRLVVDHVLAATGYRVDVDSIAFLDRDLRARVGRFHGFPSLDAGFESTVPGLFFAGLSSAGTFGPLMRFVCGTDFAAPRLARAVSERG